MAAVRSEVQAHLPDLAAEILVWQQSGFLDDGKLRAVAEPLNAISEHESLGIAQNLVTNAALSAAARAGQNPTGPDLETWAAHIFKFFPGGIHTAAFLDLAHERGFSQEEAASHVRSGLDAETYGLGEEMQLVKVAASGEGRMTGGTPRYPIWDGFPPNPVTGWHLLSRNPPDGPSYEEVWHYQHDAELAWTRREAGVRHGWEPQHMGLRWSYLAALGPVSAEAVPAAADGQEPSGLRRIDQDLAGEMLARVMRTLIPLAGWAKLEVLKAARQEVANSLDPLDADGGTGASTDPHRS